VGFDIEQHWPEGHSAADVVMVESSQSPSSSHNQYTIHLSQKQLPDDLSGYLSGHLIKFIQISNSSASEIA
jgi:hypothetical protein